MRKLLLALAASATLVTPALAQVGMPWPGPGMPSAAASTFAIVASTAQAAPGLGSSLTTTSINTTGANLVVAATRVSGGATNTLSDTNSNTWDLVEDPMPTTPFARLWNCHQPCTVGSGHQFTVTSVSFSTQVITVAAFSGAASSSSLDQHISNCSNSGSATIQPGSITPSQANEMIYDAWAWYDAVNGISSISINSGQTMIGTILNSTPFSGIASMGHADELQTTATARNPTWTASSSGSSEFNCAFIASFK
jgi:hypothetical protein